MPMAAAGPDGLEAVIVKTPGPGRHPLALLSHGSPRDGRDRDKMSARGMMPQLTAFARRGFIAASVMRRGYGTSGGGWADAFGPCDRADYTRAGRAGAADLRAALSALSKRDDVDASRMVAVGVSAGGFATVALTADPPHGLVAAISFAGGRGSSGPDTVCDEPALIEAFRSYGATSRVPMLWVYADNDHFFGPKLAHQLHDAFQRAGGRASFVAVPPFGDDGHMLFSAGGTGIWAPLVDAFLQREGFATAQTRPGPPALLPPRQLTGKARGDFQTYLDGATHKAFAVTPGGGYAWRTGRSTAREASDAAIAQCEALSHANCQLYAIDDAYAGR